MRIHMLPVMVGGGRCLALGELLKRTGRRNYGYVHVPKKRPPHLLGFGSEWRKCFVVHPHSQTTRPLEAYQWLSGSVLQEGLPASLPPVECGDEELTFFEERLETAFEEQGQRWGKGRKGVEKVCNVLASSMLGLWMSGAEHLRMASLTMVPRVESFWRCEGSNFLCVTHPLFILHCTQPLALFSDPTHCYETLHPPVDQPRHLGLFEHCFDQITPFAGCHRFSPTCFTHTLFSADLRTHSREQLLAHGLIQLFSQSTADCLQNGFPLDSDLAHPLSLQGVLFTGQQLTFLGFQLNTLDLRNREEGRRNVLWVGPTLELFSGGGVNRKCSELLWQFLMHTPSRKRPALSGFGLKRASLVSRE